MIQADTAQNEDPRSTSAFIPGPRALKIGVMHVMLSSLSSIASQLREDENETAKNLLLKYFTPDSVQQKFEILCGESDGVESNPEDALIASQLVPLFMQIVSIIWKLKDDEKIAKKKGVSNTVIGLDPCKLLLHFTKYTQLHPKQACIHTYGAATVEILKTLNSDEMLFDAINTPLKHLLATVRLPHMHTPNLVIHYAAAMSNYNVTTYYPFTFLSFPFFLRKLTLHNILNYHLKQPQNIFVFQVRGSNHPSTLRALEICSSPEPQSLRGNVGGKRKPKNASSPGVEKKENTKNVPNFELESSIVLLGAVLNSDRKLLSSEQEATLFLSIRNTINSILLFEKKMEGPWVSDVSNFVRCAYLWALSALKEASLNATEHSSTNSNNSMDGLLSWIKGNLLPSFCHTENTPYFQIGNGGKNGDRGQKKKSSDLEGILSPAMKFPPRSRVRLGTPGKDLKLNGNNTSTSFGFLVGVQVMQVMLLVLSDAIVMNILITEVIDLMLIIAENISNSPEKIKIVNALRQILMRMSALLSPSGEKSGLVVKKIENLVKDSDNEQRKEEVINDSSNDENDENERNKNVSNNEIENDENQKVRNEGDNGVFRTPGNIKLAVNSMTNTPVKNIFPSGIDDDFTRLSMESKTNEL